MIKLIRQGLIAGMLLFSGSTFAAGEQPQAVINIQGQQQNTTPRPTARPPATELSLPALIIMTAASATFFEQFPLTSVWTNPFGFTQEAMLLAATVYCAQHLFLHWDDYASRATYLRNFFANRVNDVFSAGRATGRSMISSTQAIGNMLHAIRGSSAEQSTPQEQEGASAEPENETDVEIID